MKSATPLLTLPFHKQFPLHMMAVSMVFLSLAVEFLKLAVTSNYKLILCKPPAPAHFIHHPGPASATSNLSCVHGLPCLVSTHK